MNVLFSSLILIEDIWIPTKVGTLQDHTTDIKEKFFPVLRKQDKKLHSTTHSTWRGLQLENGSTRITLKQGRQALYWETDTWYPNSYHESFNRSWVLLKSKLL